MYFALNFLSFQSINIARMLTYLGQCSVHGTSDNYHLTASNAHAGYTIAYHYRKLHQLFPDAKFILFKESSVIVEDHLLFGYYHNLYRPKVQYDFKNYWDISVNNGDIPLIRNKVEGYYNSVRSYFADKPNLIEVDLTPFNGSFNAFIVSNEFAQMVDQMNLPVFNHMEKIVGMQNRVGKPKPYHYVDYLVPGDSLSVPVGYPMNVFLAGMANFISPVFKEPSYIVRFENELNTLNTQLPI